ncbi:MAG TPA: IS21-like element helper ATPase IstB [Bacillota bacterium]|jgi:DNA replication protein DnaC|nr:IS21-like element helper ATPase IstB [Bacillota bacterium]HQI17276.1 IS21-like element helper ATPase IstB [Bacillota bacterium]HQO43863.1 IS21-like element helper ATPase IstB [Bacillota bacterium]HQQ45505.1 IS21-like element helper ATPase IstB [Bacillota bacterium]
MLNNQTIEKLRDMKLKTMAQMLSQPDPSYLELSFEERLGLMVEKEWMAKKNSKIKRLLRNANLGLNACIEDIDYSSNRTINKQSILELASCDFIEKSLNIITTGKTGSGKTYLICAFGNSACRKGYTVKYFRIPELLLEIQEAKSNGQYSKFMKGLQSTRLLILDDIGLKSYTLEESRDILEIAESRYNRGSMILSGQISQSQWYELFPDPTIADAIMDRIIHNSYILELDSKLSMREVIATRKMQNLDKT